MPCSLSRAFDSVEKRSNTARGIREIKMKKENENKAATSLGRLGASAGLTQKQQASIRDWLAEQLIQNAYAKLGQGGHTINQVPLRQVFVDLPVASSMAANRERHERRLFLSGFLKSRPLDLKSDCFIQEADTSELDETARLAISMTATIRRRSISHEYSATLLIGGPGQGKSTLGQLACQLHRAALLAEHADELISGHQELLRAISAKGKASERYIRPPSRPLLPIQISLPEFIGWYAKRNSESDAIPALIRYTTDLPSAKASGVSAELLYSVIRSFPSLLFLDGFDEVGAQQDRATIVHAAQELLAAMAQSETHAQILATTRPQGYAGELAQIGVNLQTFYLVPLRKEEALDYAGRLLDAKIDSVDDRAQAISRLKDAASDAATQRLLTSPLQVTIFAALVQQIGRAPRERWNLFLRFFSYTYEREVERGTYASKLLSSFRTQIERIHARVGLLLQVEAERAGGASARMSRTRLEQVIDAVLDEDGFLTAERPMLVAEIAKAAEQRLVFLVEAEPDKFGFDIRSLQEFMAAWALCSGRDSDVESRLQVIAKSALFKNVFLFMASKLFSEGSALREILGEQIFPALDSIQGPGARHIRAGACLALETIEEGAVLSQPRHAKALLHCASELLSLPANSDHLRLARVATPDVGQPIRKAVEVAVRRLEGCASYNTEAAWVCLLELINAGDDWAIKFADQHWEEISDLPSLAAALDRVEIQISGWLLRKFDESADRITLADLYSLRSQIPQSQPICTWTHWILASLFVEERWANLAPNTDGLSIRARRNIPKPPAALCPTRWEHWRVVVEYEARPGAASLAAALRAIANNQALDEVPRLSYALSWPLTAALEAAPSPTALRHLARRLTSGELGDAAEWISAEEHWNSSTITFERLFSTLPTLPWEGKTVGEIPPPSLAPWWVIHGVKAKKRDETLAALEIAESYLKRIKRKASRVRIAELCLDRYMQLPQRGSKALPVSTRLWMTEAEHSLNPLIPRPGNISADAWRQMLDIAEKASITSPLDVSAILKADIEDISHPILLRLCICAVGTRRFSSERWRQALERVVQVFECRADLGQPQQMYLEFLRFLCGLSTEDTHEELGRQLVSRGDSVLIFGVIRAVRLANAPFSTKENFLAILHDCVEAGSRYRRSILEQLRQLLQGASSDLTADGMWTRLMLPYPTPEQNGVPEESNLLAPVIMTALSLKNIGGVRDLKISLAPPDDDVGQWVVLIGPNGAGKTTLLRSAALGLRNASDPSIWPRGSFSRRWPRFTHGTIQGESEISISLKNRGDHLTKLRNSNGGLVVSQFPLQVAPRVVPVFAYGCRRGSYLKHRSGDALVAWDDGPEIATLFDDEARLIDPESWMIALEGDAQRNTRSRLLYSVVVEALLALLELDSVFVRDMEVWVKEKGRQEVPFSCLSDGYFSTSAWVLDLIARWTAMAEDRKIEFAPDLCRQMTGIVLIDEIDIHIHPSWQLDIISRIRAIFPRMSFIATTHNPLTLVGAEASEIWQLKVNEGEVVAISGLESPMSLSGGQIYKQYFEISDTFPTEIGRDFKRYSFLSGYSLRSEEEEVELLSLQRKLKAVGVDPGWEIVPRQLQGSN